MNAREAAVPASIREGTIEDDARVAGHFRSMWLDNGVAAERIQGDWQQRICDFIRAARGGLLYRAFIAETPEAGAVGSASCQLFAGLYPDVLTREQRRYGYIWGVYVEPAHRRCGIATALTRRANAYLASIGCSHVLLHASPPGRPVYAALGFEPTNEMRLGLGSTS
jgi:ribosomal protein S18 acetylase RimI-like enzyme